MQCCILIKSILLSNKDQKYNKAHKWSRSTKFILRFLGYFFCENLQQLLYKRHNYRSDEHQTMKKLELFVCLPIQNTLNSETLLINTIWKSKIKYYILLTKTENRYAEIIMYMYCIHSDKIHIRSHFVRYKLSELFNNLVLVMIS